MRFPTSTRAQVSPSTLGCSSVHLLGGRDLTPQRVTPGSAPTLRSPPLLPTGCARGMRRADASLRPSVAPLARLSGLARPLGASLRGTPCPLGLRDAALNIPLAAGGGSAGEPRTPWLERPEARASARSCAARRASMFEHGGCWRRAETYPVGPWRGNTVPARPTPLLHLLPSSIWRAVLRDLCVLVSCRWAV